MDSLEVGEMRWERWGGGKQGFETGQKKGGLG